MFSHFASDDGASDERRDAPNAEDEGDDLPVSGGVLLPLKLLFEFLLLLAIIKPRAWGRLRRDDERQDESHEDGFHKIPFD
jgi:hypothetical protein